MGQGPCLAWGQDSCCWSFLRGDLQRDVECQTKQLAPCSEASFAASRPPPLPPPRSATAAQASKSVIPSSLLEQVLSEVCDVERRRLDAVEALQRNLRAAFGQRACLLRATSVDGRFVFVLDRVLSDGALQDLFECLQNEAFHRTEFARPDTQAFRHYVANYNIDKVANTEMFQVVSRLVAFLFVTETLRVYRLYTNAVQFGDVGFVHRDANDKEHVTALIYANPEWAPELGGETIFYDERGEPAEAVQPAPGRVVLFHGSILHKGSPPGRLFQGNRYTTAFKFVPVEGPDR
eukprot:TRINITY_DN77583_c0_g1_i1.p1 TRINITY_DN77583_c0_g1~~TRINITY_DN77583_c0_g1_i1.p1  ORF type:complete len:292 (-),score=55.62 TRINITY_DN77583_c0_g1_i1:273-1148(-)